LEFKFEAKHYFSEDIIKQGYAIVGDGIKISFDQELMIGVEEFKKGFMESSLIDKKLIKRNWIENHYRWVIWKLVNYERKYPEQFAASAITPTSVVYQLKYRYDKEIEHAQRSCLKKIYERDDVASRRIVLCVSSLLNTKQTTTNDNKENTIELTDGWYPIKACLDSYLMYWVREGKITVGTKLCIYGADLVGSEQGCDPLESPDTLVLKLHGNSTRRACWDTKLGYQPMKLGFCVPMNSINADGGLIGRTDLIILRKYPLQWMEKCEGRCFFRNRLAEDACQKIYAENKRNRMEKIYSEIQQKYDKDKNNKQKLKANKKSTKDIKRLRNGAELYDVIQNAVDPTAIEAVLTCSQKELASEYQQTKANMYQGELQRMFDAEWRDACEEMPERVSVQLQRFRVADATNNNPTTRKDAILTVWKPTSDIMELWKEGVTLSCFNLTASVSRNRNVTSNIQLSTNNTTKCQIVEDVKSNIFIPRKALSMHNLYNPSMVFYNELDIVGYIIKIEPLKAQKGVEQTIYLSDYTRQIVGVRFWIGLEGNHLDSLLTRSSLVSFMNLSYPKLNNPHKNNIPILSYTDFSSATKNPKEKHLKDAFTKCSQVIKGQITFIDTLERELDQIVTTSPKPPYSKSYQETNTSMITPEVLKDKFNPNLPFDLPSEKLQTRHKIQMKKRLSLDRYKEPGPLSPLNLTNKSIINTNFKPPTKFKR